MRHEADAPFRGHVYVGCALVAVVLNFFFGKDLSWDQLHYHFYAGFSALHDRFHQDYFAAGPQSYFNPYAYIPFYLLVKLGLPDLAVGTLLALLHSVVLWLTYELACTLSSSTVRKERAFFGLSATVLAFMNPVLLQQIGSSFSDMITAALVLGGWLLVAQAIERKDTKRVVYAGMLLGAAAVLKPTNAVHALAAFAVVAFVPLPPNGRARTLFYFGDTLFGSAALVAAPWSIQLARTFGNPMFPMLNTLFKSPDLTPTSLKAYRFIPDSLAEALLRPFSMLQSGPMIHEELSSPDLRYSLLLLVFLISIAAWIVRSIIGGPASCARDPRFDTQTRILVALGCGFAIDWILWLGGSGNSRYFTPMGCVAAVLSVALLFRLLPNHVRGRNGILLALFVAQGALLVLGTDYRWNRSPWEGHWFNVEVPEKIANDPYLYLSIGGPSNSFLLPFLAPGSGFVNIAGGYTLGPAGPNAARVRALIERRRPNVRVLLSGERIHEAAQRWQPQVSDVDDLLRAFDLRIDISDCATITVRGLRMSTWRAFGSTVPLPPEPKGKSRYIDHFATCRVIADGRDNSREEAQRRSIDIALDHLEDACPALFQPARIQTEHIGEVWLRRYGATDLTAWITGGQVRFVSAIRDHRVTELGSAEAWATAPQRVHCGRNHEVYFAKLAH